MRTLKDVVMTKGTQVFSVSPNDSALEVIRVMTEKGVGALLVMDGERLSGIVSERDIARKITLEERDAHRVRASDIMTAHVKAVAPELSVRDGMAIMTNERVRHLPIVENEKVVGVVSIGDLVKAIIDEQQYTIQQLEQYITT